MQRICPSCGGVAPKGGQCPQCSVDDRPSSAQRGYGSRWRRGPRARQLRAHPFCQQEGCTAKATDVDHIIRRADGGSDEPDNLQSLCHSHHSQKTATEKLAPDRQERGRGWRRMRQRQLKVEPRCQWSDGEARCPHRATQVDHITPLADGGPDHRTNLQSLCARHHRAKTAAENAERSKR